MARSKRRESDLHDCVCDGGKYFEQNFSMNLAKMRVKEEVKVVEGAGRNIASGCLGVRKIKKVFIEL